MTKKILGILFFIECALITTILIANNSFMMEQSSVAATYGNFIGTMLPIILTLLSGIFLFRFDKVYKQPYINGFYIRKKQCSKIILFIVFYAIMYCVGVAKAATSNSFFLPFIITSLMYVVPLAIFAVILGAYAVPYWKCQKNFKFNSTVLNKYISADEIFRPCSEDSYVLLNNKVLFFPKTFCIIPLDRIADIKFYNFIEQDIIFTLTNGKKIEIPVKQKQYNSIAAALKANEQ